ncbi:flagellar basal body P-ring protein FlgI [Microvirga solisilvae]|uniref:flagellar basal body P-ring protein FlgI n=1 Tax=Microvirga solisilvae TaxID=2919498 RepID=UPI001FAF21D4|nr:flagellar basal body P-ring protein FlgI [Microvirga solisilvae]
MILRAFLLLIAAFLSSQSFAATRIKDVANVQGVRDNQLIGYGLVMGLQGTGDTLRNSQFTEQALQSMLDRMGVNVRDINLRTRNVAAVIVTADLPPFVGVGSRIDVTVTSMGDATSLKGGTLMLTALQGGDGQVYAVAQGAIVVSGFAAQGQAETLTSGVATAGRIANGALIEREVRGGFDAVGTLAFELKNPDYKTATMITDAINQYSQSRYGMRVAAPRDYRTVVLQKPKTIAATRFIAELGDLEVQPDTPARIVVDQRTGTVVIGKNVQISTVAITHGALTIRVTEAPEVAQPDPFSLGQTAIVPRTQITAAEERVPLAIVRGSDLQTLVRGLNQMGLKPSDVIAILQAVKTAGALQAELVVQ